MKAVIFVTVVAAVLAVGEPAMAQRMSKGTFSGTAASFNAPSACPTTLVNLAAAFPGKAFVITQICRDTSAAVSTSSLGNITGSVGLSDAGCTSYEPGIVVPAGDVISCIGGGATSVVVNGIAVSP